MLPLIPRGLNQNNSKEKNNSKIYGYAKRKSTYVWVYFFQSEIENLSFLLHNTKKVSCFASILIKLRSRYLR